MHCRPEALLIHLLRGGLRRPAYSEISEDCLGSRLRETWRVDVQSSHSPTQVVGSHCKVPDSSAGPNDSETDKIRFDSLPGTG